MLMIRFAALSVSHNNFAYKGRRSLARLYVYKISACRKHVYLRHDKERDVLVVITRNKQARVKRVNEKCAERVSTKRKRAKGIES